MTSFFSKGSFFTRIIGIGLVVAVSMLFVFTPRITHGDWLLSALAVVFVALDVALLGGLGALLTIDAFTCIINVIWGGCDSGPPGGGGGSGPDADLKVNTNAQQIIDGATQLVPSAASDSDGPISVTVPNTSYLIKWASAQADNCDFTADGQTVANAGKRGNVAVTGAAIGTHNYLLTCAGATDTLVVNVIGPTVELTGTSPIEMPDPLKLNWTSAHVSSCTASGAWNGSKALVSPASGQTIFPSTDGMRGDHTFTLTCADDLGNEATSTKTVTVLQVPRCTFDASPNDIIPPQRSTLSWSCQYATSCSIDNGVGSVDPASGTRQVIPRETATYTMTCQGADGPRTFSDSINVTSNPRLQEVTP